MLADMAERIRLIIDTEEDLRLAVRLAGIKTDRSPSQVVNDLIREHLAAELADARKYAKGSADDKPKRRKRSE